MPHILAAGKLHPSGVALLEQTTHNGYTFDYIEEVSEASYIPLIYKTDALILRTQPLTAETVAKAPKLKVVSRHGVGYDAVNLEALNARGIALTVVGDVNSVSVAEHAMMQILALAKRALVADHAVREGPWGWRNRLEAREISGLNLLILGYGRIGRSLARMAKGFQMEVRAYDPFLLKAGWPEGDVSPVETLAEGLAWADCISVHIPKGDKPLIGADEIAAMKPNVILANTARGGIVAEEPLRAALASGHVFGAGMDVFDAEPPVDGGPFAALDNALLSPHIAGLTAECAERMAVSSVQNVLDFFGGKISPDLVVNRVVASAH
ncbi:putative 2-hydroxyacid dehydrogenase (plasmid) [Acidiphilium multivorum AIU301]|uniref:Putative 2-hydroxyacid dehydrogenase n=1 Tax=Acidiphilium multivorum (strain DSM 11245 / JCM 8867 / NBRC 100883 / AIU 301) TaxID=926570 RepID=F0J731_ACIMA|nr:hydroxyacid dehydrogenase [Acidiphilium multivorum]BAJ82898.1 putative 2-hydroxyacid dehydrogenase [Acidiphilium multivorum AIU301]GAN75312.1 2-hydroxyacid dehydrogenase [Acidiphilium multivorum AIU301]